MKSKLTEEELADIDQETIRNDVRGRPEDVFKSVENVVFELAEVLDSELDVEIELWKSRVHAEVLFSYLDLIGFQPTPDSSNPSFGYRRRFVPRRGVPMVGG